MIITFCFGNIGPKFQVPCVATSALCRDLAHIRYLMHICILVPLIYSIRLILLISADLEFVDTKLGISTFVF